MSLLDQIRQALAELELVSHAPTSGYGREAHDTTDSKGGRRPPGADHERKPRRPSGALREGDAQSEKEWAEFDEELAAWEACYHRRTVDYFLKRLRWEASDEALLAEIRRTVEAWKRQPIPKGQEPEYGSPQWKQYISESSEDAGVLATRFFCTRRYINAVRKAVRDGGLMPPEETRRTA